MVLYTIKRILWIIPILICVVLIVFTICYHMPGDPVEIMLNGDYTQEEYDQLQHKLGLDEPFLVQLWNYFVNLITKGSFGYSYSSGRLITDELGPKIWVSIKIGLMSCILTTIVSIPIGIVSAVKQNSILDYTTTVVAMFLASMPAFWIALEAIVIFSLKLGWLPASGLDSWKHYILPVLINALSPLAMICRMTRSSMLECIRQDYVRTARAKGLKERKVIMGHVLKNALIPVITVVGSQFAMVIGGSVIIESIFSIPGMGNKMVSAINSRDYNMLLATTIIISSFTMLIMLVIDLCYAFADPRIKAEFEKGNKISDKIKARQDKKAAKEAA